MTKRNIQPRNTQQRRHGIMQLLLERGEISVEQLVQLFDTSEVIIQHFGNGVLLMPKNNNWQSLREAVAEFEPDFVLERGEQA